MKRRARTTGVKLDFLDKKKQTWTVSPQPFIKDGVGEGVEQDEDGVIG